MNTSTSEQHWNEYESGHSWQLLERSLSGSWQCTKCGLTELGGTHDGSLYYPGKGKRVDPCSNPNSLNYNELIETFKDYWSRQVGGTGLSPFDRSEELVIDIVLKWLIEHYKVQVCRLPFRR